MSNADGRTEGAAVAALAAGGFAAAHAVCCLIGDLSAPGAVDHAHHHAVHRSAGWLVPAGFLVLGLLVVVTSLGRGTLRPPRWRTLAVAQLSLLVAYEGALAALGGRLPELLTRPSVLVLGVSSQLLVAAVAVLLATWLVRAVARTVAAHTTVGFDHLPAVLAVHRSTFVLSSSRWSASLGRGPPPALVPAAAVTR